MMSLFSNAQTAPQALNLPTKSSSSMESFKILLVEDDLLFRTMLEDHLSQNPNYDVMMVSCGEECIANLAVEPNLIIMDYNMNSFNQKAANGLTTLKIVKRLKPQIPVIMLSGEDDTGTLAKVLFNGAYNYVVKGEDAFDKVSVIIEELRRDSIIEQDFKRDFGE